MTVRFRHVLILVLSVTLTVSATTVAANVERYAYCIFRADSACGTNVTFEVGGKVKPEALPRDKLAPAAVEVQGTVATEDGSHPPALREVVFDLDRNVTLDPTAFPVCEFIHGSTRDIRRDLSAECPDSIVGRGTAEIAFVSGLPSQRVPLTFFNAGVVDGVIGLAVQTKVFVPVTTGVEVERARKGRYGYTATWGPFVIAGGDGLLTKFDFRLKRGYVRARCSDGKLQANITKALFRDEGETPSTTTILKGTAIRPCTPKP
jgi:hypothetical protein